MYKTKRNKSPIKHTLVGFLTKFLAYSLMLTMLVSSTIPMQAGRTVYEGMTQGGEHWFWQEAHRVFQLPHVTRESMANPALLLGDYGLNSYFPGQSPDGNPITGRLMRRPLAHFRMEVEDGETGEIRPNTGVMNGTIYSWGRGPTAGQRMATVDPQSHPEWSPLHNWDTHFSPLFGGINDFNAVITITAQVGDIIHFTDMSSPSGTPDPITSFFRRNSSQTIIWPEGDEGSAAASVALQGGIQQSANATINDQGAGGSGTLVAGWDGWEIEVTADMIGDHLLLYNVVELQNVTTIHNPISVHPGSPWSNGNPPRPGGNAGTSSNTSENGNHLMGGADGDGTGWWLGGPVFRMQGAFIRVVESLPQPAPSVTLVKVHEYGIYEDGQFIPDPLQTRHEIIPIMDDRRPETDSDWHNPAIWRNIRTGSLISRIEPIQGSHPETRESQYDFSTTNLRGWWTITDTHGDPDSSYHIRRGTPEPEIDLVYHITSYTEIDFGFP